MRGAVRAGELVRVRGGYSPDVVRARAGRPIRIAFVREETASCSERVVFPAFGRSTMLPYGQRVLVELPAAPPGTYEFTCAILSDGTGACCIIGSAKVSSICCRMALSSLST